MAAETAMVDWKARAAGVSLIRRAAQLVNAVRVQRGLAPRTCPCCGFHGRFESHGAVPRADALCPNCLSLERHRLMALAVARLDLIAADAEVLHFAPEPALSRLLKARAGRYRSADLTPGRADLALDIEAIALADDSIDVAVASHVLEHVDDAKALGELHRILRPAGRAFIMAPVVEGWESTHEDVAITDPKARALQFGQDNHRRLYGRDIRNRIAAAGFAVSEFTAHEPDVSRHGLIRGETLFIAVKPAHDFIDTRKARIDR